MNQRQFALVGLVCAIVASSSLSFAQEKVEEKTISEATGIIVTDSNETSGWGASVVSNLFAARADGTFNAFTAGLGGGFSYKMLTKKKRYHHEFGLYLAPQIVKMSNDTDTIAEVAGLLHATLFKGFGLGFGYGFWRSGSDGGFIGPKKSSLFFTIGYGLTNSTDK